MGVSHELHKLSRTNTPLYSIPKGLQFLHELHLLALIFMVSIIDGGKKRF